MRACRNAVSEICAARALYVGDDVYINRTGQQFSREKKNTAPDESVSVAATRLFMCCLCSSIE